MGAYRHPAVITLKEMYQFGGGATLSKRTLLLAAQVCNFGLFTTAILMYPCIRCAYVCASLTFPSMPLWRAGIDDQVIIDCTLCV
jgi:hypothetical protein